MQVCVVCGVRGHTKNNKTRQARDRGMFLLSGHHRIMEAAEAALVTMVLKEDWFVLGQFSESPAEWKASSWR